MSKPNGSRPAERLAAALRPAYDVGEVAAALQDCMDSAARAAAHAAAQEVKQELLPRLDKQDATLRMVWRQCGGREDQRLPIDD